MAYGVYPDQVGRVGINSKGINYYINTTHATCPFAQPGKLISNPTTTLPHTNDYYFHASPPCVLNLKSIPKSSLCQHSRPAQAEKSLAQRSKFEVNNI
jgi:hypothetical protein